MKLKRLGNSDMEITRIGLGSWAIGGTGYGFSWGNQDDRESVDALKHGIDLGINWIDTAAAYGLGHSEEIVGKALKGMSNKPYVFTKCEKTWDDSSPEKEVVSSLKAASIRRDCENSLRRMEVDAIDLLQIHWPDPDEDIEEGWTELAKLQEEGKVRWIGVSNFSVSQMERALKIAPITSLQPPYSLIKREAENEILPFCGMNDIGVIVYSPMESGLLSGKMTKERAASLPENDWRSRDDRFKEPNLSANLEIAEQLKQIAQNRNMSVAETAIAWTLVNPNVTGAIVGVRSPTQVDGIIGALESELAPEDLAILEPAMASR